MIANYDPDDFDPIKTLNKIIRAILIGFILLIILASSQCHAQSKNRAEMVSYIAGFGIKHPEIVYAQMMLESGNFRTDKKTSWTCCNNAFGFFYKGKYLNFDNLEHCLEYYKWWQDELYKGGDYYSFLKRVGFAEEPTYIERLKKFEN